MITIKRTTKDTPDYGSRKLYSVHGFTICDYAVCLIDENGLIIWIHDDGYIIVDDPEKYNYSCHYCNITIGEYLKVAEDMDASVISSIFENEEDFRITFEYTIEPWIK